MILKPASSVSLRLSPPPTDQGVSFTLLPTLPFPLLRWGSYPSRGPESPSPLLCVSVPSWESSTGPSWVPPGPTLLGHQSRLSWSLWGPALLPAYNLSIFKIFPLWIAYLEASKPDCSHVLITTCKQHCTGCLVSQSPQTFLFFVIPQEDNFHPQTLARGIFPVLWFIYFFNICWRNIISSIFISPTFISSIFISPTFISSIFHQ